MQHPIPTLAALLALAGFSALSAIEPVPVVAFVWQFVTVGGFVGSLTYVGPVRYGVAGGGGRSEDAERPAAPSTKRSRFAQDSLAAEDDSR